MQRRNFLSGLAALVGLGPAALTEFGPIPLPESGLPEPEHRERTVEDGQRPPEPPAVSGVRRSGYLVEWREPVSFAQGKLRLDGWAPGSGLLVAHGTLTPHEPVYQDYVRGDEVCLRRCPDRLGKFQFGLDHHTTGGLIGPEVLMKSFLREAGNVSIMVDAELETPDGHYRLERMLLENLGYSVQAQDMMITHRADGHMVKLYRVYPCPVQRFYELGSNQIFYAPAPDGFFNRTLGAPFPDEPKSS